MPSPCVGVCTLDEDGLCLGCARTGDEIAAWPTLSDPERLRLLERIEARALGLTDER